MRDLIALIKQYKEEGRSNAEIRRLTELNYYNAEDFTEITEDGELIIADGITSISQTFAHREYDSHGNLEFYPDNNKTIKRIKVPDSVKDIMHDAFASLHALEEVVLPEDLKYIGENAFANCEKLKKINIPEAVTTIGPKAFLKCQGLEEVIMNEGIEKIGEKAFANCENLKRINIPETVNKMGSEAFANCYELEEINIPSALTTIKSKTFAGCRKLENVVFQEGLETIEENAFLNCANLKNINFPESLEKEEDAFIGCKEELTSTIPSRLKMDENGVITNFFAEDIHDGVYTIPKGAKRIASLKGINKYVGDIEEIVMPDGLRAIDDGVIRGLYNMKKMVMPDSVVELGDGNFADCYLLEKVRLSRNLKTITSEVRADLAESNVTCLIIPDSTQLIKSKPQFIKSGRNVDGFFNPKYNFDRIYYDNNEQLDNSYYIQGGGSSTYIKTDKHETTKCFKYEDKREENTEKNKDENRQICMSDIKDLDKITRLNISSSNIRKIGPFAVSQCPNLEEVFIEEGVTEIGPGAFAECENLKRIYLPKNIKEISDFAFYDCPSLEEIIIDGKSVKIGDFAFTKCSSLERAVLPERVSSVGKSSFYGCKNLKYTAGMENVDIIDQMAFAGCEQLKISIPNKIKEIGDFAYAEAGFKNWDIPNVEGDALKDYHFNETMVIVPSNCEKIGKYAFRNCKGIKMVHFNEGSKLTEIKEGTFENCNLISVLDFPEGMNLIGNKAFKNCKGVEEVYFPESIQEIGNEAFLGCKSLEKAIVKGHKKGEQIAMGNSFEGCNNLQTINFSNLEFETKMIGGEYCDVARKGGTQNKGPKKFSIDSIIKAIENRGMER
ncbi:MAG: leucine-rich repeat domain-containing protein [Clostridia bacterium]|nr:leucine-rich repeat domain-containing protein [Clostridia bacterium]